MFSVLPYGLTPGEFIALKIAYNAGCFEPGTCSCRQPKKQSTLKEIAEKAGYDYKSFSHHLNNARRKIISASLKKMKLARDEDCTSDEQIRLGSYESIQTYLTIDNPDELRAARSATAALVPQ